MEPLISASHLLQTPFPIVLCNVLRSYSLSRPPPALIEKLVLCSISLNVFLVKCCMPVNPQVWANERVPLNHPCTYEFSLTEKGVEGHLPLCDRGTIHEYSFCSPQNVCVAVCQPVSHVPSPSTSTALLPLSPFFLGENHETKLIEPPKALARVAWNFYWTASRSPSLRRRNSKN